MLRFLLFRLWPALIPLLIWVVWLRYRKRKGDTLAEIWRGGLYRALIASMLLLIASFLWYGAMQPPAREGKYVPPRYDGTILSPAHLEPETP
jgi:hypothetical protein